MAAPGSSKPDVKVGEGLVGWAGVSAGLGWLLGQRERRRRRRWTGIAPPGPLRIFGDFSQFAELEKGR